MILDFLGDMMHFLKEGMSLTITVSQSLSTRRFFELSGWLNDGLASLES